MHRPRRNKRAPRRPPCIIISADVLSAFAALFILPRINFTGRPPHIVLDSLDGVYVYNNGPVGAVYGRDTTGDGYNIGLRYQCVEFVKRYYLYHYGHRMPDPYGHAKDFFDGGLPDGEYNARRGLVQMRNGSRHCPQRGDIIVFGPTVFNRYGHVAIVSQVGDGWIEIVQQNPGKKNASREKMAVENTGGKFHVKNRRALGWLRMCDNE